MGSLQLFEGCIRGLHPRVHVAIATWVPNIALTKYCSVCNVSSVSGAAADLGLYANIKLISRWCRRIAYAYTSSSRNNVPRVGIPAPAVVNQTNY